MLSASSIYRHELLWRRDRDLQQNVVLPYPYPLASPPTLPFIRGPSSDVSQLSPLRPSDYNDDDDDDPLDLFWGSSPSHPTLAGGSSPIDEAWAQEVLDSDDDSVDPDTASGMRDGEDEFQTGLGERDGFGSDGAPEHDDLECEGDGNGNEDGRGMDGKGGGQDAMDEGGAGKAEGDMLMGEAEEDQDDLDDSDYDSDDSSDSNAGESNASSTTNSDDYMVRNWSDEDEEDIGQPGINLQLPPPLMPGTHLEEIVGRQRKLV
jgi:hypothetical protein